MSEAIRQLARFTECAQPTQSLNVIVAYPSDNRILECADAGNADFIITGDERHILPLRGHGKAQIVTAADFMKGLQEKSNWEG